MSHIRTRKGLYRLIYFSSFSPGFPSAETEQDVEVAKIVRTAVQHNRDVGLTGLLLVYQQWFLQALEGPEEAVRATYSRIRLDPRHQNAVALGEGSVAARVFSRWTMCARRLTPADNGILQTLDLKATFDPHRLTPVSALRLLTIVKNIQLRNAGPAGA